MVLQVVGGYSPLASGVALLPLTVIMLLLSSTSGRLASRIGPRLQMGVGPVVIGCGLALLSRVGTDSSYLTGVLPAVVVFGLGLAATVAPLTATALSAAPIEHAGLASAVNNDVARIGGLIAVAVLPALSGISGSAYLHPAQLADGFRTATMIAAVWCVAGGRPRRRRDPQPDGTGRQPGRRTGPRHATICTVPWTARPRSSPTERALPERPIPSRRLPGELFLTNSIGFI